MQLRDYQLDLKNKTYDSWQTHKNVLAVLPTGSGKTALFSNILQEHRGYSCAIAHRQELVSQISLALANYGVRHRIIGPSKIVKWIVRLQVEEFGKNFYDSSAPCAVAGVRTLNSPKQKAKLSEFFNQTSLWVTDECHHVLADNKWGKACSLFSRAKGLGVTATPERSDGAGLGRHADGVFDDIPQFV